MQGESTRNGSTSGGRLVLGYDAGCSACTDLADRVARRVGDKLDVRNLRDPELQGWREQALGEDAKWAPTLFRVDEGSVEAWTGWRMGWALSRAIGPAATWQVMQALGEVGAAPKIEESKVIDKLPEKAAEAVVGMSRGRFLKGVGGAALAASMLTGAGPLVSPAAAARRPHPYDVIRVRKMASAELATAARQAAATRDVGNVAGQALSTTEKIRAARPLGYVHTWRNGTVVQIVVYEVSADRILMHAEHSEAPRDGAASVAKLIQIEGRRNVVVKASEGGQLWRRPDSTTRVGTDEEVQPLAECPPVGGGSSGMSCPVRVYTCTCWELSRSCGFGLHATGYLCAGAAVSAYGALQTGGALLPVAGAVYEKCGLAAGATAAACCTRMGWVYKNVPGACAPPTGP